ncbi:MAG: tetratricopeptide repeat protein [Candidatus Dormibacteria bacterium]
MPKIRLVATSREALRVPGEATYAVPGLALPSPARSDAVQLFLARAAEVNSSLSMSDADLDAIATICARLDGLPLAIELAASRARSLSIRQIQERLGASLDLLSKGTRGADGRQATLRGAIEWSHRLLTEGEQVLFRRLAVFDGGWQLEAAEEVCSGEEIERGAVFETLDALVDKSLVAVGEDATGDARYRLLETIGAYATERLEAAGESDLLADRHASWYSALVAQASESTQGSPQQAAWFDRLETDHANLLAALGHLVRRAEAQALELARRLGNFWLSRAHWRVARNQLEAVLVAGWGPSPARAKVLSVLGTAARALSEYPQARAFYGEALAEARDLGNRPVEGYCLGGLGTVAEHLGDFPEARVRFEEALALARELRDRSLEGVWLGCLGNVAHELGDYSEGRARYQEALDIARDLGDRHNEGLWLGNLGNGASALGDYPQSRALLEEALGIARDLGNRPQEEYWVGHLGQVAQNLGDYPEAWTRFEEALAIARELGDRRSEGQWLSALGAVACNRGDYPESRARYDKALAIARGLGDRRNEGRAVSGLGETARAQGDYSQARAHLEEALVITRQMGDRAGQGNCLRNLGLVATALGDFSEARAHYQGALDIVRDLNSPAVSAFVIDSVAILLGAASRHEDALELVAWSDETRRRTGLVRDTVEQEAADQVVIRARGAVSDAALQDAQKLGAARSAAEMLDIARDKLAMMPAG